MAENTMRINLDGIWNEIPISKLLPNSDNKTVVKDAINEMSGYQVTAVPYRLEVITDGKVVIDKATAIFLICDDCKKLIEWVKNAGEAKDYTDVRVRLANYFTSEGTTTTDSAKTYIWKWVIYET